MSPLEILLLIALQINGISDHYDYAHCIVTKESNWVASATGAAGERGLAQIMPATGQWFGEQAGFEFWDPERLFEPEVNLYLLSWALAHDLDHHWSTQRLCKEYRP